MATDGCWGPMCDFTGTRLQSDAKPGRCTKAPGYVAYAEINEIIKKGDGAQTFRDNSSDSDIMLYKGTLSYLLFFFLGGRIEWGRRLMLSRRGLCQLYDNSNKGHKT